MEPNKKLSQGCFAMLARTALVRLISVVVVLVMAVVSCGIGMVVGSFKGGTWGLITGTLLFAAALFGGGFGYAFITVYRRKLYLDKAFLPIGLKGSIYRIFFRRYAGEIRGRQVEVYFSRGPMVEILIRTDLKTRLGVSPAYGDTMFFSKHIGAEPLEHNIDNLKNLRIWADEEPWARNLLSEPSVQQKMIRTLGGQTFFVRSFLKFFPEYLQLHFSGNTNIFSWEIPPAQVEQWFSDAFGILEFAESGIAPPQNPIEMSSAERLAVSIRRKDTTKISIILVASMLFFFFFVFVVAMLFVFLVG
ncbi:MAG: hypothetical protein OEM82_00285 [Acidobacteriota bacterium]|nr:hypothetical protein [Acidobacteriota bacterium]MDH3529524.1 hypothetical protein [Acidobacteriota bacterium]